MTPITAAADGVGPASKGRLSSLLTEDEAQLQRLARRFMREELAPLTPALEEQGIFPPHLFPRMGELGLLSTFFPEHYGGSAMSIASRAIVSEEMCRVNPGLDVSVFADIMLFARALLRHGSEIQKRQYLVPVLSGAKIASMGITETLGGSDALSAKTFARKDGEDYILNGAKTFITNAPVADYFALIARTSGEDRQINGGTWFILERGMPGLETGKPFRKMGMKSSPTGEIFMSDVRVPAENVLGVPELGFHYLMESLDAERVLEGASTLGIAEGCLDACITYAQERKVFGKPIASYQLIQEKIAAMAVGIEMTRTLLYRLLRALERDEKVTLEASILKLYSSQMAVQASSDAVQIFGGYGYMEDSPVARFYRDAKHHEIGAGTSEIQKIIISREILRQGVDPAHPGSSGAREIFAAMAG